MPGVLAQRPLVNERTSPQRTQRLHRPSTFLMLSEWRGSNPSALWAVADRLAQREGTFRPFERRGPFYETAARRRCSSSWSAVF